MNYRKHYIKLVRKAQLRSINESYTEKHHIFPKSIFGKNSSIVKLTAKEHFVAHHLLWKYYQRKYGNKDKKTVKMMYSFHLMVSVEKNTARHYSNLRQEFSSRISECNRGRRQTDEQKEQARLRGLGRKHKPESIEKMKARKLTKLHKNRIGEALKGRKMSEEWIEKLRQANAGKHYSDEINKKKGRKGMLNAFAGRKHSEEAKEKMRLSKLGKSLTEEHKKKVGRKGKENKRFGHKCSKEAIENMRRSKTGMKYKKRNKTDSVLPQEIVQTLPQKDSETALD